jgi:hypothetical protein
MIIKKSFRKNAKLPLLEGQVIHLPKLRVEGKFRKTESNIVNARLILKK